MFSLTANLFVCHGCCEEAGLHLVLKEAARCAGCVEISRKTAPIIVIIWRLVKNSFRSTPDGYTLLVKGYFDLDSGAFFYNQRFLEGLVVLQLEGDLIFSRWKRDLGRRGLRVRLAVYQYLCAPWRCVYINKNLVSTTTKETREKVRMRVFCFRQIQWFQGGRKAVDLAFVQIYVGNRFLKAGFA